MSIRQQRKRLILNESLIILGGRRKTKQFYKCAPNGQSACINFFISLQLYKGWACKTLMQYYPFPSGFPLLLEHSTFSF